MSSQRVIDFAVKKRNCKRKTTYDSDLENKLSAGKKGVKRSLFGDSHPTKKLKLENDMPDSEKRGLKLAKNNSTILKNAKQAFHTSLPTHMIGRDKEIDEITLFVRTHIEEKKAGSLYISGSPGTGKTSSLMHVLHSLKNECAFIFLNCMCVANPFSIYKQIADKLCIPQDLLSRNIVKAVESYLIKSKTMTILVLDEIDHLDCKGQDVLYSLFSWPQLPNSTLILVGIANALDLTDRVLPRLQAFKFEPQLMHFQPYTCNEIARILESRLLQAPNGREVMKPNAIQLCSRKVAACTGDIRKALDVCRRAIEVTEKEMKQQLVLKSSSDDRCNPGSPNKRFIPSKPVDLHQINTVLSSVYGSRIMKSDASTKNEVVTLPLQQAMVLCSLILMKKCCKDRDITCGRLYDVYKAICRKRQTAVVGESEFQVLCQLIEARGFIGMKKNKFIRMTNVSLRLEQGEIEHVLQDRTLLTSVLADTSVIPTNTKR